MSTPTPESVLRRSWDRRSLISEGISLALFEVEVDIAEVGTFLTGWATEGFETIPAISGPHNSVNVFNSDNESSGANGSGN